ncbi:hypothetical protein HAX54_019074, partial [Datura stramonium]|nr:hypothetical protein [Datura stramonium]
PGTGVIGEVKDRHTYDDGPDGRQPGNGPSLVPSRSSPFSLWAIEVSKDRQASDSPS